MHVHGPVGPRVRTRLRIAAGSGVASIANRYVVYGHDVFYLWLHLSQGLFHREVSQ
jgi:hypothetical protein